MLHCTQQFLYTVLSIPYLVPIGHNQVYVLQNFPISNQFTNSSLNLKKGRSVVNHIY